MENEFDVMVIGSGPGGYVAAIRAAQLGLKTACVEKYATLGGTCLNVGCIPSKALLRSSELYHQAHADFAGHGIEFSELKLNLGAMLKRKDKVVSSFTDGISFLLKKNKVTHLQGVGKLLGQGQVEVAGEGEPQVYKAKNIILATGSKPTELPFLKFDKKVIVSSTEALAFDKVPEHLVVVGGGVIGLELGSVWQRLGAKVTVIEYMDRILPPMDKDVSKEMNRIMKRQGMKIHVSTGVTGAEVKGDKAIVFAKDKKGKELSIECDRVLVSVGRRPYTTGLGVENAGVNLDEQGRVVIDEHYRTSADGIYAIGDVVRGIMLAHKAEDEGIACAEIIAGKSGHVNYDAIPNVVYTWPEVASVGKTEDEIKSAGTPYRVGKFSFKANSRARCVGDDMGMVKIIAHAETDLILGVHMVGPNTSELIAEAVLAMEYMASAEDLARTVHAHPTLAEAVKEAALDVDNRAIHA